MKVEESLITESAPSERRFTPRLKSLPVSNDSLSVLGSPVVNSTGSAGSQTFFSGKLNLNSAGLSFVNVASQQRRFDSTSGSASGCVLMSQQIFIRLF